MKVCSHVHLAVVLLATLTAANTGQFDRTEGFFFTKSSYRIFYNTQSTSCLGVIIGVGTNMARSSYDALGHALAEEGHVAFVVDHYPGFMVKTSSQRFELAANRAMNGADAWLRNRVSYSCQGQWKWVVGGHSAGGQAAANALQNLPAVQGFLGLDPFDCNAIPTNAINIPNVLWGFEKTTCQVTADHAAKACHERNWEAPGVFYQVGNLGDLFGCYNHCSFTDEGCVPGVCGVCGHDVEHVTKSVAESATKLLGRINAPNGQWTASDWTVSFAGDIDVTMHVNA